MAFEHLLYPWVLSGALSLQRHAKELCQAILLDSKHFSWIPEPAKNVSMNSGVGCGFWGTWDQSPTSEGRNPASRSPTCLLCDPGRVFSLSVVPLSSLQTGILNDGAGDEVPTKVLLAEVTLTAFVIIGLSPAFAAIRVGLSSK